MAEPKPKDAPALRQPQKKNLGLRVRPLPEIGDPHSFIRPLDNQPESSQPDSSRLTEPPHPGYDSRPSPSRPDSSQLNNDRLNLIAALPPVGGHMPVPHQITDHLLRHLSPSEQAVYVQLYRLSWGGYRTNYCFITNDKLAERANMSVAQIKKVTAQLQAKGLIEKIARPHGQKVVQGVEYRVRPTNWQLERSQPQNSQPDSSRLESGPNKEKDLKKDQKDFSQCPDCFGSGFWYPEGTAKGARPGCQHPRLRKGSST
ncbi:MAG TPA: helix-turn-helix domain-containing protein [Pyrinomonadaceae bacterium]|jgi:hypothetical protein